MQEIDKLLKEIKRIHFIGIGGSGMCPLAEILHDWGYQLSGSDNNESDNVERMKSLGIPVIMGQKAENIKGAEMIVYTAALLSDNPELVAAKESGIPTFERATLFGAISRMYSNCMAVCGTHGKTTVTSMLTQIMVQCGKDPSAVIGGTLPLINSHGRSGKSENFVCEACEFVDTFLQLSPDVAIILNIDEDHLDYFKTLDNIIASFRKFASMATKTIIYNGDDENTLKAVEGIDKKKITFGFDSKNDYYPENISFTRGAFAKFDVCSNGKTLATIQLGVPGKHNILNALAAIATALDNGVGIDECIASLSQFKGAGRRFEMLGQYKGITFADDYAHHPAELKVTLEAAMKMDYNAVWAVFQPFTYSRTYLLMDDFAEVLKIPTHTVMTEIMGSRERNTYNVYTSQLAEKIPDSVWFNTFEEVADYIVKNAKEGDLVITLGCGDIYKAARMMIKKLN
ncbi:MAG: UDP-N-acetylmuramate--L-alanine ligase, partial [Clostridiales bacterium]|nr:UDP-N-acetylmuramate--L-alanine ligase [Clostridiales bacterium]